MQTGDHLMAVARNPRPVWIIAVGVVLAMTVLLAGCIEVAVESEFDSDGSARHSIAMLVDRSLADDPTFSEELDFEEMQQEARDAGFEADLVETDQQVGVRMFRDVSDNEDLGTVLNALFSSIDTETPPADAFSGSFTTSGGGSGRATRHSLTITVDADALFAEEEAEIADDLDFPPEMMRQFFNITYAAVLPGEIVDHNGQLIGSSRVEWNIPFEGVQTFQATSEEGGSVGILLIAGAAVGALALLLVAIVGVLVMSQRRRTVEPMPSDSPPGTAEPSTPDDTHRHPGPA
jgi:hypothetical protein